MQNVGDPALMEYLERHQIYTRFQQAIEALAVHKPESPCAYLKSFFDPSGDKTTKTVRRVILLGPPRVGKTVQGRRLADESLWTFIDTPRDGAAIEDIKVVEIVRQRLSECSGSWVLDGFPATELEAYSLRINASFLPTVVIDLQASLESILARTPDDEQDRVRTQYEAYRITRPAMHRFFDACLRVVDCEGLSESAVAARISAILLEAPVVKTRENEVIPRGPALISDEAEIVAYTMSEVPNTKPKIEEVN